MLLDQGLRAFDQRRQHDEEIASDERGDERVARGLEQPPGGDGREAGHEAGEDPQRDQHGHRGVGDLEHAQARDLLEVHRAGGVRGDREEADRRERATRRFARASARSTARSDSISPSLRSTPMSAMPRRALNSTTAGTTLFAREWKGFDGM